MTDWTWRPYTRLTEMLSPDLASALGRFNLFGSFEGVLREHVYNSKLLTVAGALAGIRWGCRRRESCTRSAE